MTVHDPDLRRVDAADDASDPAEAGGLLSIDLAAIEANWRMLASTTVPVECAAVAEGRRVRALAPEATIYVLNGVMPGSAQAFANDYLQPVINSTTELAEWDAFVAITNWRGGAALHVDTGMNRLGLTMDEAAAIAPRLQSE